MWSRLIGGGLSRQKVDAVIRLIDRDLAEEDSVCKFQADKQTIHLRDLSPDKRGR